MLKTRGPFRDVCASFYFIVDDRWLRLDWISSSLNLIIPDWTGLFLFKRDCSRMDWIILVWTWLFQFRLDCSSLVTRAPLASMHGWFYMVVVVFRRVAELVLGLDSDFYLIPGTITGNLQKKGALVPFSYLSFFFYQILQLLVVIELKASFHTCCEV